MANSSYIAAWRAESPRRPELRPQRQSAARQHELSEAVRLEEVQPDLADGRERWHRVPQPVHGDLAADRDGGRVQQLLHARTRECRAHDSPARVLDDQLAGAGDAVALGIGARHVTGGRANDRDRHPGAARSGFGEAYRAYLRIGERDARNDRARGHVSNLPPGDHVGRDACLVLAHVAERGEPIAVPDGIQPGTRNTGRAELAVDSDRHARLEADGLEPDAGRGRPPADGDEYLIGRERSAVVKGGDYPAVPAVATGRSHPRTRHDADALGLECRLYLVARKRLLVREQPVSGLDDDDTRTQAPECLRELGADGPAAEHE